MTADRKERTIVRKCGTPPEESPRFAGLLGLSMKAGKLAAGEFSCENAVKSGKAKLCLIAADSSENTGKHFRDMCKYRNIPFLPVSGKEALGHMIGKRETAVAAVMDEGFAAGIMKIIEGGTCYGK